jgi:hypothetical protein
MNNQRPSATAIGTGSGLAVVVILLVLAVHTVRSNLAGWSRSTSTAPGHSVHLGPLVAALAVVVLVAALLIWLRVRHTRRTLASHVRLVVLAAEDFDPTEDAVVRAAAQFSRVRRTVLGWLDTRASGVRLRLDSGSGGQMVYQVGVARRGRSVVRIAFTSLGHLEVRNPEVETTGSQELREAA